MISDIIGIELEHKILYSMMANEVLPYPNDEEYCGISEDYSWTMVVLEEYANGLGHIGDWSIKRSIHGIFLGISFAHGSDDC